MLFLLFVAPACVFAKNVALVIGNSEYTEAISRLDNPKNDAEAIAAAFVERGFDVVLARDLGQREMQAKFIDFRSIADGADIAVVYYAGHGIEISGQNYLVPVDARLSDQRSAALELINMNTVLDQLSGAKKLRMLVLDACRNNPFVTRMKSEGAGRSVGRGLGRVDNASSDTLVAFAAAAGEVTPDGEPGGHSPFTAAFLNAMRGPAVDVRILLGKVRDEMRTTLRGSQPAIYGSLGGEQVTINPEAVALRPAVTSDVVKPEASEADMINAFLLQDAENTIVGWDGFLTQFATYSHHALFKIAINKRSTLLKEEVSRAEKAERRLSELEAELARLREGASATGLAQPSVAQSKAERQIVPDPMVSDAAQKDDVAERAAVSRSSSDEAPVAEPVNQMPSEVVKMAPEPKEVEVAVATLAPIPLAPKPKQIDPLLDKDAEIRALQELLKERNCYSGKVDALVGPNTLRGLKTLASKMGGGLRVSADASALDYRKLFEVFSAAPQHRCASAVVKKKKVKPNVPTRKTKARVSNPPKPKPVKKKATQKVQKQSATKDYRDKQGNHCDWYNRGNVCE